MNIDTETRTVLDNVFGMEMSADFVAEAKTVGLRSAMSVVVADEALSGLRHGAVSLLIRTALRNGLGEMPFGWTFLRTDATHHELTVWVLDGTADEPPRAQKERVSA